MSQNYDEVKKFAKQSLGEMPQVIELLFKLDEESAMEQFKQNQVLYLGRSSLSLKTRVLLAISVALANGPKESAMIHYKLAKKFNIDRLEILDAIRATKMALMSSTLDSLTPILGEFEGNAKANRNEREANEILIALKKENGMVPERVADASRFSLELTKEHLREKEELLRPLMLAQRDVFAIALGVSISIRDGECEEIYLRQFLKHGGTKEEVEDILTTVRFITGNRAFVNSIDILKDMTR
ncbi:MAG: carboxymuconolactone decarboxylase family protein [Thermoplasmata archaeon]